MRTFSAAFLYLASLSVSVPAWSQAPQPSPVAPSEKNVILISIDGLRPEFLTEKKFVTPNLRGLIARGTFSADAIPVFPSLTYPNHATLMTGTGSAKHGVLSNTVFNWKEGVTSDWYWYAKDVKASTLWQKVKEAGKSVAIMRWPATVGAGVDWIFPEIFHSPGIQTDKDWELITQNTRPEFLAEILENSPIKKLTSIHELDELMTHATIHVLEKYRPALTLLHFVDVDLVEHMTGRDSKATQKSVQEMDQRIGRILGALDPKTTTFFVVGDHGFMDYRKVVQLNTLFKEQGWIKLAKTGAPDWKVMAHAEGGQAAIYLRDKALAPQIMAVLKKHSKSLYRIMERRELDRLQAYPEALCAVEANPGYVIGSAFEGPLVTELDSVHGHHGYLSSRKEMHTAFIAAGPDIHAGRKMSRVELRDIAPTLAAALDVELPTAEGKPIHLK